MNPFKCVVDNKNEQHVARLVLTCAERAIRAFQANPTLSALLTAIVEASREPQLMRQLHLPICQYMEHFMLRCMRLPRIQLLPRTVLVNAVVILIHCAKLCDGAVNDYMKPKEVVSVMSGPPGLRPLPLNSDCVRNVLNVNEPQPKKKIAGGNVEGSRQFCNYFMDPEAKRLMPDMPYYAQQWNSGQRTNMKSISWHKYAKIVSQAAESFVSQSMVSLSSSNYSQIFNMPIDNYCPNNTQVSHDYRMRVATSFERFYRENESDMLSDSSSNDSVDEEPNFEEHPLWQRHWERANWSNPRVPISRRCHFVLLDKQTLLEIRLFLLQRCLEAPCSSGLTRQIRMKLFELHRRLLMIQLESPLRLPPPASSSPLSEAAEPQSDSEGRMTKRRLCSLSDHQAEKRRCGEPKRRNLFPSLSADALAAIIQLRTEQDMVRAKLAATLNNQAPAEEPTADVDMGQLQQKVEDVCENRGGTATLGAVVATDTEGGGMGRYLLASLMLVQEKRATFTKNGTPGEVLDMDQLNINLASNP